MLRGLRRLALAAGTLLAATSVPAHAEWHRAESKHFIVYADTSENDLRQKTERLERFDAMMRLLFNVEDTVRVQIFMLPSITDVQDLANNRNVGGFYSASAQLAYGFVPVRLNFYQEGYTAESVSMHEYAHHMLLGGTDRYVPGWATEGIATMFMTAILDDKGGITVGAPNPAFSQATYSGSRWSVEKLIGSDDEEIGKSERIELYSRGWALAHYLWFSGKRPGEYVKFIAELNKTGDAMASAKKVFGDLDELNKEVNAYLRRKTFPASYFSAEQLNTPSQIDIRELTAGEDAILKYRMISLLGVDKERSKELALEARPVGALYPNDPFVQRAMAEIDYDYASLNEEEDFRAAEADADRTLAVDPDNLMAMVYKGRIAARRSINDDDPTLMAEARQWFLKANRADPNHPLPFMLLYDTFLAQGLEAPEPVVGGLYRAVVLLPQDLSLRARAAVELIRADDIKRARSVLAPAAFNPHAASDNPMRKLIEQMDEGLDKEGLLEWIDDGNWERKLNDFLAYQYIDEDEDGDKDDEDSKDGAGD